MFSSDDEQLTLAGTESNTVNAVMIFTHVGPLSTLHQSINSR
jgi:hypothetical protein